MLTRPGVSRPRPKASRPMPRASRPRPEVSRPRPEIKAKVELNIWRYGGTNDAGIPVYCM